ncbi:MAG: ATP-binding protein [Gemmatimonadetes bacterium]|nr:ATP-binding protein [Gemmatimonadota bacterium]
MGRIPDSFVVELSNDISAIETCVEEVVQWCGRSCRDRGRLLLNFRVGLTEALSNAMLYGNAEDPDKTVRVELRIRARDLHVKVTDQGRGFDPSSLPDPRTPDNLTKAGGRGIFLMRKLMDEVRYNASGNSVTLVLREIVGRGSP